MDVSKMTATYQSDPVKDADEKIQSVWLLSTAQLAIELQLSAPAAYPTALAWLKSASDAEALSSVNEALSRPETQLGERNTPIMIGSGEVKKLWYAIVGSGYVKVPAPRVNPNSSPPDDVSALLALHTEELLGYSV